MKRRLFLKASGIAGGTLFGSALSSLAATSVNRQKSSLAQFETPLTNSRKIAGYALKIMATTWGNNDPIDLFCQKVKKEGYDGIEVWWPKEKQAQTDLFAALAKYKLDVGFLCAGQEADYQKHFGSFKLRLSETVSSPQRPLYINCHTGRDYFSYEENSALVQYGNEQAAKSKIKILHETHRSRMLFAAPVAKQFLESIPGLRITLDISHWCNVSESLLADQQATVDLAISRTDHVHARIGHPEGPQVNDPRAPEWENAVKAHFGWWDKVVTAKQNAGELLTILTEFGPVDYMPAIPYTRQPVADQWAINYHMLQLLRKRYS
jgi:sugar phosphate isomerase/epimerase